MPTPPITFPQTPLTVKVELALGADLTAAPSTWVWTDATPLVYVRDKLTITRGRPDESTVADSAKLAFTADNRGGHWSSRNPNSPWFGLLRKGTPIRVSVEGFPRYSGFIAELPPRWDPSGRDRYAPVVAQGLLYRLGQGAAQERSAALRTNLGANQPTPLAYWPFEDAQGATSIASALSGGEPLRVTNGGDLNFATGITGSVGGLDLAGTTPPILWTTVQFSGVTGYQIEACSLAFDAGVGFIGVELMGATDRFFAPLGPVGDGVPHHQAWQFVPSGSDVIVSVYRDGVFSSSVTESNASLLQTTRILVAVFPSTSTGPDMIAHLVVYDEVTDPSSRGSIAAGYDGELAHTRFLRLCDEEGLPGATDVTDSQAMGPQGADAIVPLLRECEASDQAFLFEDTAFGLYFQGHQERENQPALLQLDYDAEGHVSPPLEPTDDDQQARNDVEVKRDGGSSARLTEEDPNVELSIPNIGRRSDSVTYSLNTDDQTRHLAGWRLHLATYPGYRYPTLSLNLAAGPDLIPDVCTAGLGFRTTIANPPDDIGPDAPSVIVEGYAETLGAFDWDLQANCSLQGPWEVSVLAADTGDTDPHLGWLDFDTLTLSADVDTDEVTWLVNADPVDTTSADDFPRDMLCEGELITVTACSGSSAPQTWTVTRSVNGIVKSHTAAVVITLAHPFVLAL